MVVVIKQILLFNFALYFGLSLEHHVIAKGTPL